MFSIAVQHLNDVGKFLPGRATGSSTGNLKPVMTHYDIATSYTIHEGNGNAPVTVGVNFPSDDYAALDYTPVWEHHRFVEWTTKPPYDAEIEYLESSGTQWVDTGVIPDTAGTIVMDAQLMSTRSYQTFWSAREVYRYGVRNTVTLIANPNGVGSNTLRFDYSAAGKSNTVSFTGLSERHEYKQVSNKLYIDGNLKYTASSNSFVVGSNVYLLMSISPNSGDTYGKPILMSDMRVFSVQIINANGVLVRNFIPVRVGSVGYLYDKVSEQLFGNAGTGEFVRGGDIKVVSGNTISPSDKIIYDVKDIYASWQSPATVTFDATTNGGQMPSDWVPPDYYEGQPYGTLPTPTHATLNFTGWYINGSKVSATDLVQANATLVAQYAATSYSVDISNGDWELEDPNTNPDTSAYDGVYRNSRYWNDSPGEYVDKLYIHVVGYTSFTVYIRSNAEVNYSYTVAVKADYDPISFYNAIDNAQGATTDNSTSTEIGGYTAVTYALDGGSHTICIVYGHKDDYMLNDDRGYLLIPKQQ